MIRAIRARLRPIAIRPVRLCPHGWPAAECTDPDDEHADIVAWNRWTARTAQPSGRTAK